MEYVVALLPLFGGWFLDLIFGDPVRLPHPIVGFGKMISFFEYRFNRGAHRRLKGGIVAVGLIVVVFCAAFFLLNAMPVALRVAVEVVGVFYCLAGTTLIREVTGVARALDVSLEAGRRQVARIVGRDTESLSDREVRAAALETLAENLSDGVIAPLFWYGILGLPGMLAYKMVNTLDSMIGYRNERYREFGCVAARIDDVANYIPARLTALLLVISSGSLRHFRNVLKYGPAHASPNSGFPEAALASVLDCRFGGPHDYFGEEVVKPYIGDNPRDFSSEDMVTGVKINRRSELIMVFLTALMRMII
ncbi:adenosylcobinamide-phosphate synthase CbiB [uncultured Muribaculum sp.]|uniref:adenosylcobinamide-phosphate synthase CbiB n=1 Tax=uncultured Muribaculum sp. TaxID=1918613 RepID=UPI002596D819|nr:adenosylcobinamide-phosphate synthase CbiB [uncultured Muribaculum sp.]